jgi:hypothetical protein
MPATIAGLTPENYEKFRAQRFKDESGSNYIPIDPQATARGLPNGVNRLSYVGGYQMGAQALETVGLLKPGAYAKSGNAAIYDQNNWVGTGGQPKNLNEFLYNSAAQDKAYEKYTIVGARTLETVKTPEGTYRLTADTPQEQRAGWLAAASLSGPGAVVKKGLNADPDANGVSPKTPFIAAQKAVSGATGVPTTTAAAGGNVASDQSAAETQRLNNAAAAAAIDRGSDISADNVANLPKTVDLSSNNITGEEKIPLPIINPLEKFVSSNYLFTLSSLSADAVNFPDESYRKGLVGRIILSSGGRFSESRVSTAYQPKDNPSGKYDYFIDNVEMYCQITPSSSTKGTNVVTLDFEVTEPYSMGQFLQSCQIAAVANKHTEYTQAPYLLSLEFVGTDSNNIASTVAVRYFPIRMYSINMTITSAGCKYQVKSQAWNELALNDNYNFLKSDFAISGKTVVEMLQSGPNSLQHLMTSRLLELSKTDEKKAYLPDEIAIVFPDKVLQEIKPTDDKDLGSTTNLKQGTSGGGNVLSTVQLTRNEKTNILIQAEDKISPLGKSSMNFSLAQGGHDPKKPDDPNATGDITIAALSNKKFPRNSYQVAGNDKEFVFRKGTSIINAITEVMLMSNYCTGAVTKTPTDGFYDWFRIETQAYITTANKQNENVGVNPKLLVFRVIPYKIHQSLFAPPNLTTKGYQKLLDEAVKEYNYIYTGKNVDILDFKLTLNNNFGVPLLAEGLGAAAGEALMSRLGQSGAAPSDSILPYVPSIKGNSNSGGDVATGTALGLAKIDRWKSSDGGGDADTYKTLVAKQFQARVLNLGTEKVRADMTIIGDPYYIVDSGLGNFTNTNSTSRVNLTATGAMDYQSSEVDVIINFRTPVDLNPGGSLTFPNDIKTQLEIPFSGLYKVITVKSKFEKGKFTQILNLARRANQDPPGLTALDRSENAAEGDFSTDSLGNVFRTDANGNAVFYRAAEVDETDSGAQVNPNNGTRTATVETILATDGQDLDLEQSGADGYSRTATA